MKKLFFLFVLVAGMAASTFAQQDTIVYNYGSESIIIAPGVSLNNFLFSETVDGFTRLQEMNGMVQYSANGKSFWLKYIRLDEDTIAHTVKILSAVVVADPTLLAEDPTLVAEDSTLVAEVIKPTIKGDDRMGPDQSDPDDSSQGIPWPFTTGIIILAIVCTYPYWKKLF